MAAIAATAIGVSMISGVLRPLATAVATMAVDQYDDMRHIESEISNLQTILQIIEGFIIETEGRQIDDGLIRRWREVLNDISISARLVVDMFNNSPNIAHRSSRLVNFRSLPCFSFLRCFNVGDSSSAPVVLPLRLRVQLANDIRSVKRRMDDIMEPIKFYVDLNTVVGEGGGGPPIVPSPRPEIGPFPDKQRNLFLGRGDVKEGIMKILLDVSDDHVHLVPIWGLGGIGKTTLAKSIYNDKRVKEKYYPSKNRRWLSIREEKFDATEIIKKIVKDSSSSDGETLTKKLVEHLSGNRFLIVLHDVWDLKSTEWSKLWDPLTNVGKGGVIIITTRIRNVISATNTQVPEPLNRLSDEDSWKIFKSYAFADGESKNRPELESIGREIVEKFDGHPLAAQVVGSSLLNEPDAGWKEFLTNWESNIRTNDIRIMAALRWSYNLLPPHLKRCFAYCTLFPKYHALDRKVLVEMWMAHGYIQNVEGGGQRRPEDVGSDYLKKLVDASLFQCIEGRYVMHNLIHELAVLVSNGEFGRANNLCSRHITFNHDPDYCKNLILCRSERILTLYTVSNWFDEKMVNYTRILADAFRLWKNIRVLVLVSSHIICIPDNISELRCLRYLDINKTRVRSLPDSLCLLHELQMLAAPVDAVVPKDMVNMTSLRYLRANLATCKGVGNLTSLQELSSITVCKDDNIRELRYMNQLRGKLTIKGLENVTILDDDSMDLMEDKKFIDELQLEFSNDLGTSTNARNILEALGCPRYLRCLNIVCYAGDEYPKWMADKRHVEYLQTLKLSNCHQLKSLPALGEMKFLEHLSLELMDGIERLGDEFYGKGVNIFPSLKSLMLKKMKNWKVWGAITIRDSSASFFSCLTELTISKCPVLKSVIPPIETNMEGRHLITNNGNVMRYLKRLEIQGCSELEDIISAISIATKIENLNIFSCERLTTMDFQSLPSLRHLKVDNCVELISISGLIGVKDLGISDCDNLKSLIFSNGGLDYLETLKIFSCSTDLEISNCPSQCEERATSSSSSPWSRLQHLYIDNEHIFRNIFEQGSISIISLTITKNDKIVKCLEKIMESSCDKLKSLKNLTISECNKLQSLPTCGLPHSLLSLVIHDCRQLKLLPAGGLPLSLTWLQISDCPLLYVDRHKINYIRHINI